MSSIIQTMLSVLTRRSPSETLPTTMTDIESGGGGGGMRASDILQARYSSGTDVDDIELQETVTEEELVLRAYSLAKHHTFRDTIYVEDFYKNFSARVPTGDEDTLLVWRIDADSPVLIVLVDILGAEPLHIIQDIYGDQVIFRDDDVRTAVNHLVDLCNEYNLPVQGGSTTSAEVGEDYTTINL